MTPGCVGLQVKVFYNATDPPHSSSSCIEWGDGSRTEANGGCVAMDRWRQAATKTLKTDEEDAAVAPAGNLKPHGFYPGLRIKHCF